MGGSGMQNPLLRIEAGCTLEVFFYSGSRGRLDDFGQLWTTLPRLEEVRNRISPCERIVFRTLALLWGWAGLCGVDRLRQASVCGLPLYLYAVRRQDHG